MKKAFDQTTTHSVNNVPDAAQIYHRYIRGLHWIMAFGFVLMWLTGVLVTNVEGVPYFVEEDRQGAIRDLHKSIGFTLLGLLIVRIGLKLIFSSPAMPGVISKFRKAGARLGHIALYIVIVLACLSGIAIADLHEYGNAYFGIELPQVFPTREYVAGWASTPWSYILHAVLAYTLLFLCVGHILAVWLHKRSHSLDLLPRMYKRSTERPRAMGRLIKIAGVTVFIVVTFAARGFMTTGELEEPRDYKNTTPFTSRD
ncbi:cytochrome b/b6 domain-containing protein [Pseudomonas pergaminensis]|uniref:cytochrome b n=1 Tax=Pseudomonas pergaminensis TaxID=2853159 RepID=UPI0034D56C3A